jgi:GNAT superfamily N-acetyltransferase
VTPASSIAPITELAAKALDVNAANLAIGHERFEADLAVFVRNRAFSRIYDANHVSHVTAANAQEIDRLFARVDAEYEGIAHRRYDVDFRTPPEFVARLVLDGYERTDALVLVLERDLAGETREHEIRAVETEADWVAYADLHAIDWSEHMERQKRAEDPSVPEQMRATHMTKQPPVQYWLAYVGGFPRAYFNSWAGIDGFGQVEDLFTHPDFRHQGLATALIQHCVSDCRRKGAGPIVIVADPTDTPKQMYVALGFRPVAVYSHYLKRID